LLTAIRLALTGSICLGLPFYLGVHEAHDGREWTFPMAIFGLIAATIVFQPVTLTDGLVPGAFGWLAGGSLATCARGLLPRKTERWKISG
jgi:hypothetical protein